MSRLSLILTLVFASSAFAAAPEAPPYSIYQKACTPEEMWTFSARIPSAWKDKFSKLPVDRVSAIDVFAWAHTLQSRGKETEAKAIATYWMGRSLHSLGLIHLADQVFGSLLLDMSSPETFPAGMAALECQNLIRRAHTGMSFTADAVKGLQELGKRMDLTNQERETVREAVTFHARGRLENLTWELSALQGSGPYEALIRAYQAALTESEKAAVLHAEQFLKFNNLPAVLQEHQDPVRLIVARAHYNAGEYDKAIQEYAKLSKTSNFLADSLIEQAWAHLLKERYSDAASSAYNLIGGGVRRTFSPDAAIVMAISQFETCNYPDALKSIKYYRRNYVKSFQWLYQWAQGKAPEGSNLYEATLKFLTKQSKVPEKIGTEWVRSPVFISSQQEINLLIDEKLIADELIADLAQALPLVTDKRRKQAITDLKKRVQWLASKVDPKLKYLVAIVNRDLHQRNRDMVAQLRESLENSQLVEIEIYDAAGQDIIVENLMPEAKDGPKAKGKPNFDGGPVLDWGKFPAELAQAEKAEIWDDELDSLKTKIVNHCPPELAEAN